MLYSSKPWYLLHSVSHFQAVRFAGSRSFRSANLTAHCLLDVCSLPERDTESEKRGAKEQVGDWHCATGIARKSEEDFGWLSRASGIRW